MKRQVANRRLFVGWIEDQQTAQCRMLNDRAGLSLIGDFDGDDAVVELLWRGPSSADVGRITRVDTHWKPGDTDDLEHRAHQVCFVFAVAVGLRKDLG